MKSDNIMSQSKTSYVNVSCANLYRNPTYHTEIDSQVTLWEEVEHIETNGDFIKIRAEDGYIGWVSRYQLEPVRDVDQEHFRLVTVSTIKLFEFPDPDSTIIREAVAGSRLPVFDSEEGWLRISLPDEKEAWVEGAACTEMSPLSPVNLVLFSRNYLGIPYFWGGKTPKGMDCSGFVQLVFKLFGIKIRRDAWMQHEDARPVSNDPFKARPGDLLFFAEAGERITHVAIAMDDGMFIHARGMVRINSMDESHMLFDPSLKKSFVDVKTYF